MNNISDSQNNDTPSLYDRVGKELAIDALAMSLYGNLLADKSIAPYFENIDLIKQIEHQKRFLTFALGGPSEYSIDTVVKAHYKLNLKPNTFVRFNEILYSTLKDLDLSEPIIKEIMELTASIERKILNPF